MNYKKKFGQLKDVAVYGAMASQSTSLLTTYKSNPAGAIPGMVGVGVAGGVANAAFNLASGRNYKKKKRR